MGELADYAKGMATALRSTQYPSTADIRGVQLPGYLVEPMPAREYGSLDGGFTATFKIVCLGRGPGDLADVEAIEDLAARIPALLPDVDLTAAEPASYVLPGMDPKPALICSLTMHVHP